MPDNSPRRLFGSPRHHDGGEAECRRLAERAIAALNDLANLDPRALEVASIVITDLRHLYPSPDADAGPEDPIVPPRK